MHYLHHWSVSWDPRLIIYLIVSLRKLKANTHPHQLCPELIKWHKTETSHQLSSRVRFGLVNRWLKPQTLMTALWSSHAILSISDSPQLQWGTKFYKINLQMSYLWDIQLNDSCGTQPPCMMLRTKETLHNACMTLWQRFRQSSLPFFQLLQLSDI